MQILQQVSLTWCGVYSILNTANIESLKSYILWPKCRENYYTLNYFEHTKTGIVCLFLLTGFLCMIDISSADVSTWRGVVTIVIDNQQTIQAQGT